MSRSVNSATDLFNVLLVEAHKEKTSDYFNILISDAKYERLTPQDFEYCTMVKSFVFKRIELNWTELKENIHI